MVTCNFIAPGQINPLQVTSFLAVISFQVITLRSSSTIHHTPEHCPPLLDFRAHHCAPILGGTTPQFIRRPFLDAGSKHIAPLHHSTPGQGTASHFIPRQPSPPSHSTPLPVTSDLALHIDASHASKASRYSPHLDATSTHATGTPDHGTPLLESISLHSMTKLDAGSIRHI